MPLLTTITESLATLDNATTLEQRRKVQSEITAAMGDMLIDQAGALAIAHAEARQVRAQLAGQEQRLQLIEAERDHLLCLRDNLQRRLDLARHPLEPVTPSDMSDDALEDVAHKLQASYLAQQEAVADATAGEVIYDAADETPVAASKRVRVTPARLATVVGAANDRANILSKWVESPNWSRMTAALQADVIRAVVAGLCDSDGKPHNVGRTPTALRNELAQLSPAPDDIGGLYLATNSAAIVRAALEVAESQGKVQRSVESRSKWIAVVK
jgi:hypothetical protein